MQLSILYLIVCRKLTDMAMGSMLKWQHDHNGGMLERQSWFDVWLCSLTTEKMEEIQSSQEEQQTDITDQSINRIRQHQAWQRETHLLFSTGISKKITRGCVTCSALTLSDDQAEGEQEIEDKVDCCQFQQQLESNRWQLGAELRCYIHHQSVSQRQRESIVLSS